MNILCIPSTSGYFSPAIESVIRQDYPAAHLDMPKFANRPTSAFAVLDPVVATYAAGRDIIVGLSVGGFWANYFSLKYQIAALMVTPVVNPSSFLQGIRDAFCPEFISYEIEAASWEGSARMALVTAEYDGFIDNEAESHFRRDPDCSVQRLPMAYDILDIDSPTVARVRAALRHFISSNSSPPSLGPAGVAG